MRPDYEVEQKGDQQSRSADSKHVNDKSAAPELAVLVQYSSSKCNVRAADFHSIFSC